jgi:AcrR family transcriptional regulator
MSDKREQLLEASIDLFAKEGFWNTPTSRIAKHAGVATGTLFNYFPTKDALIDAVYMRIMDEWADYVMEGYPNDGDIKRCLGHLWYRVIDWGVHNPQRYALKQQLHLSDLLSPESLNRKTDQLTVINALIQAGFEAKLFKEISIDYFVSIVMADLDATVRYAVANEIRGMSLSRLITVSFDIFWEGVTV